MALAFGRTIITFVMVWLLELTIDAFGKNSTTYHIKGKKSMVHFVWHSFIFISLNVYLEYQYISILEPTKCHEDDKCLSICIEANDGLDRTSVSGFILNNHQNLVTTTTNNLVLKGLFGVLKEEGFLTLLLVYILYQFTIKLSYSSIGIMQYFILVSVLEANG